jgi:hypothetical protein
MTLNMSSKRISSVDCMWNFIYILRALDILNLEEADGMPLVPNKTTLVKEFY